ncbi:MAG: hypothetical protein HFJ66_07165 [Eggerthellaceae bacterium]|nr:hypothetical protein [Eggerthellaceae bacterium]
MDTEIPLLDQYTIEVLVDHVIMEQATITYGELAEAVGRLRDEPMSARGFSDCLGRIQNYCKELGLPALSVMVTLKGEPAPGDGFADYYRKIHPEASTKTDEEIISEEMKGCLACEDWGPLLERSRTREAAARALASRAYEEGSRVTRTLSEEIKRSPQARAACLAAKGTCCIVCEKDLEAVYGVPGIVHVHHLEPLSESNGAREVDPIKDLVPVCPNCHAVIHSKKRKDGEHSAYTPNEVRAMLGLPPLETH